MRGIAAHRPKSGHKLGDLAAIHWAHPGFALVSVYVDMKNAFMSRATVIDSLHCPRKSFAADSCADGSIIEVLTVWNRTVARQKDNLAPIRERNYTTKAKSDTLCCKRVWSREVSDDLATQRASQFYFDPHFSFAKPSR